MKLGVRGRLFLVSLLLLGAVGLTSGLILESQLRGWLESRVETELFRYASVASDLAAIETARGPDTDMDSLADRLGKAAAIRVTVIAPQGRVLGDSNLSRSEIANVENHWQRPEVQRAVRDGHGVSRRYSTTIQTSMLYVAVPFDAGDGKRGVARAAKPLADVDAAVGRLRLLLLIAGTVGLGLAVFMSGLASHLLTRTLRRLVSSARAIAHGDTSQVSINSSDELGRLAGSLNQLSRELESSVGKLARERDRVATILSSMDEAVLAVDADQRITMTNPGCVTLLGVTDDPVGTSLIEAVRVPELIQLIHSLGDKKSGTIEIALGSTSRRQLLAHVAPLKASGGHVIVFHDVTEVRKLEAVRRDFVANVSHELRTPLSVIVANTETLLAGASEDSETATRFLEGIHRSATRLAVLVADLLDLSRIEAGEHRLKLGTFELAPIIDRVVEALSRKAHDKGIVCVNEVSAQTLPVGDAKAVEQIVSNLLDNAIKYCDRDGHIVVRATTDGGRVCIEVVDDGPGIPAQHCHRIFERFYRVDAGRSREVGGTGLGLAIVKHLANNMDGEVGLRPALPRGCTFWFSLPAS